MRNQSSILALAAIAFSYLFYDQNAGINFLIFDLIIIGMAIYRNPVIIINRKWQWTLLMCLMSCTSILFHSSVLSIFANIISIMLLSAYSVQEQSSALTSLFFSGYSLATAPIRIIMQSGKYYDGNEKSYDKIKHTAGASIIVVFFAALFLKLYRNSNPLFEVNTAWVSLNFISFPWITFTIAGFVIIYGLFHYSTIPSIENYENELPVKNRDGATTDHLKLNTERMSGLALFIVLNMMLLILNAGDIHTLWMGAKLPEGMTHSDFVHYGAGNIIFSILLATGLILYLFRKNYAVHKYNKHLKFLVYIWILQTVIMLLSTASRNQLYINEYSLTYLRIGVYVWLLLAAIGLALTAEKIHFEKSNWYLVKKNAGIWFTILAISSTVNWDRLITNYTIKHTELAYIDYEYLFSLSDSNIPELKSITKREDFATLSNNNKAIQSQFHNLLKVKIHNYIANYHSEWQSWDLTDKRITESIMRE